MPVESNRPQSSLPNRCPIVLVVGATAAADKGDYADVIKTNSFRTIITGFAGHVVGNATTSANQ